MKLSDLREDYTKGGIDRDALQPCPFQQLEDWLRIAHEQKIPDANAITVATANQAGIVTSRTLLLKGIVDGTLQFFTNYRSQKARDIAENPNASITIHWKELERQICVWGPVKKTSRQVSEDYFAVRPYGSQIGAWVSEEQSGVIESRDVISARQAALEEKFPEGTTVPCPEFWGGFELTPSHFEFWQGRQGRLHDRFRYAPSANPVEGWTIDRLSP